MDPSPRVKPRVSHFHLLTLLLLLLLAAPSAADVSYSDYCSSIAGSAPDAADDSVPAFILPPLSIASGYFSGGDSIFGADAVLRSISFQPGSVRRTSSPGVAHIAGTLSLIARRRFSGFSRRNSVSANGSDTPLTRRFRPRLPRLVRRPASLAFTLDGFWSSAAGALCLVGTGSGRTQQGAPITLSAVFKLQYPALSNLSTSFSTGSISFLDCSDPSACTDPIAVVFYSEGNYNYTVTALAKRQCSGARAGDTLPVFTSTNFSCIHLQTWLRSIFRFERGNSSTALGITQPFMSINQMHCSYDGNVRMFVALDDQYSFPQMYFLAGNKAIVAEGLWDADRNQLCLVGCHVNAPEGDGLRANLSVGTCSLGMSFWFPAVWSIDHRSFAGAAIWTGEAGNSSSVVAWSTGTSAGISARRYEYTRTEEAKKYCSNRGSGDKENRYPDGSSVLDLAFQFTPGESGTGYANPVAIGLTFFDLAGGNAIEFPPTGIVNISYDIRYGSSTSWFRNDPGVTVMAEGVYNARTGELCLVGCKEVNRTNDCQIRINAQFAAVTGSGRSGDHIKGKITSLRNKDDPLYFEAINMVSHGIYVEQAEESIWRMDMESVMVLVSLTVSCVITILQLSHISRNSEVLPFISTTMLAVMSVGYMIPLVLNFEAVFFTNRGKQTVPLWTGGWLEVNEVSVRVVTMVAFLLQLRLFHVALSKKAELWEAERKALWICLPLYALGTLIEWLIHQSSRAEHSIWEDLTSYTGLILDLFLLPQVLFNVFSNGKPQRVALAPSFYIGSAILRILPHIYDVLRSQNYLPHLKSSYIYASPRVDLYSTTWDIIVPCVILLLTVVVYLQQRLGGRFFHRGKGGGQPGEYEMVATVVS